jgi:hypothetical protein
MPSRSGAVILLVATAMLSVAGCTRSVEWDEEVPLNTGETIWVHRRGSYTFGSTSGNPLEHGYQADRKTSIEFKYRGKNYSYVGDVTLQVLAITPQGVPNLIVSATDYMWQWKHDYRCVRPSYVQLMPGATGEAWTWPSRIEPWLYGMRTNLLIGLPERSLRRLSIPTADRDQRNALVFVAGNQYERIDPAYQDRNCKRNS